SCSPAHEAARRCGAIPLRFRLSGWLYPYRQGHRMAFCKTIIKMNVTVKDTLTARGIALNPWTGFYFLQSLLINFALGYEFSLLYAVAFSCVLLLLWRTAPRVQKALLAICSLVAAMYFPF